MLPFPDYADSRARAKLAELERLMDRTLTNTQYIDGARASKLLGAMLRSYRDLCTVRRGDLTAYDNLSRAHAHGSLFGATLAAMFDAV